MHNAQVGVRGEIFHFTEIFASSCHTIKKTMILIRLMGDYPMKSNFGVMYEQK